MKTTPSDQTTPIHVKLKARARLSHVSSPFTSENPTFELPPFPLQLSFTISCHFLLLCSHQHMVSPALIPELPHSPSLVSPSMLMRTTNSMLQPTSFYATASSTCLQHTNLPNSCYHQSSITHIHLPLLTTPSHETNYSNSLHLMCKTIHLTRPNTTALFPQEQFTCKTILPTSSACKIATL